jgi:ferric iron reductase protein FhuF
MEAIDYKKLEQKFNITLIEREQPFFSVCAEELLNPDTMNLLLHTYGPLIKANDLTAPATYFSGNLGMLALALQYSISIWNRSLDLSLSNITVQLYKDNEAGYIRFAFVLHNKSEEEAPTDAVERGIWLKQVLTQFYKLSARPIIESLSRVSAFDAGQLWGQLPTRFNYNMDLFGKELDAAAQECGADAAAIAADKARLIEDYGFLRGLEGSLFGRTKNPLDVKIRYIEDSRDPNKQVRMKNACCLYYKTGEGQYCYTCPRLKESDREQMRIKFRALEKV